MLEMRSFILERCSAALSLDKMPPLLPSFSTPLSRLPGLTPNPRVLSLRQAPSLSSTSFWFLFILNSIAHTVALPFSMAKRNSAKNFFERTRAKGSENNKDGVNREESPKDAESARKDIELPQSPQSPIA